MNNFNNSQTPSNTVGADDQTVDEQILDEVHEETEESDDNRHADADRSDTINNSSDVNGMEDLDDAEKQLGGDVYDPDEAFDADAQGLPAGTPGHPGIDDDTA